MHYSLRHVIRNYQLRTVCCCKSITAVDTEIVRHGVIIIIEFKAQADLRQAVVGCQFVDVAFCADQANIVEIVRKGRDIRSTICARRVLEIYTFQIL